jgi:HEAT repeat protein
VRSIDADAAGNVQIAVDDVRRHMVRGNPRDPDVQALLLSAVREESNPGLRVESIGMLQNSADSEVVRSALLDAVTKDPNPSVRLKALDGLKSFASEEPVRRTLTSTLLHDDDARVRMQAIDLLTTHRDEALVGVLQSAMEKEDNDYVRSKYRALLAEMKASLGTY